MRKKLMFLAAACALCIMPLSSCSKDEETPMDAAKKNVAGTEWLGYDSTHGPMTLTFGNDNSYCIYMDASYAFSEGTYRQDGTRISFNETREWYMPYDYTEGIISYGGGTLTIPMYYYDGEYAMDVKFTLHVLK